MQVQPSDPISIYAYSIYHLGHMELGICDSGHDVRPAMPLGQNWYWSIVNTLCEDFQQNKAYRKIQKINIYFLCYNTFNSHFVR